MKTNTLYENDNFKAVVSIPGWARYFEEGGGSGQVKTTAEAYTYVPLINRAVQTRVKALQTVPYHLKRNGVEVENEIWPVKFNSFYPETFKGMLALTETALLLNGGCIWKKLNNMATKTRGVQWINPNLTQVNYAGGAVEFIIDGKETLGIDELVYFRRFNPLDDVGFGVGAALAALSSAKLLFYLNEFSGAFFEHGAMPAVLLGIPQGTSSDERDRLENWFKRAATGFRNAWKAIGIKTGPDGIVPTVLTPDMAKMAMPELYEQAKQQIAQVFEIPQTMLEDAANYATAGEHRQQFWHDTIRPEGEYLQEVINDQLLRPLGYEVVLDFDQMDQFQEDEDERATAFFNYVNSRAVPPAIAAEMLGLELPEGIEYTVLDEWYREQTIDRPLALQQASGIEVVEKEPALPEEKPRKAFEDEVQVWRRRVLKRLKAGKPANGERDFYSDIIPEVLIETVQAQLEKADEAKANLIFDNLLGWEGYP